MFFKRKKKEKLAVCVINLKKLEGTLDILPKIDQKTRKKLEKVITIQLESCPKDTKNKISAILKSIKEELKNKEFDAEAYKVIIKKEIEKILQKITT